MTRTYAVLPISRTAYDEVKRELDQKGYTGREMKKFRLDGGSKKSFTVLDMYGVALTAKDDTPSTVSDSRKERGDGMEGRKEATRSSLPYRCPKCGATLCHCDKCGAAWCLDHQENPLVCPLCNDRPSATLHKDPIIPPPTEVD